MITDEEDEGIETESEDESEEDNEKTKLEIPPLITGTFFVFAALHLVQLFLSISDKTCVCNCIYME